MTANPTLGALPTEKISALLVKTPNLLVERGRDRIEHGDEEQFFADYRKLPGRALFIVHHKVKTTGFSRSALAAKIGFKEGVAAWTIDTGAIRSTRLNTTLCG